MRTQILQNSKILIVDDQEANVALLRQILEHYGFARLHSFTDPRSVAPLFDEINPDLVLLDLQMPHIDGLSLLKQLRSRIPEDTYLPFLILTADLSNRSKQEALALGAKDFLTKPFDQMEVVLRIYNLLETRLLHLELQEHNRTLEEKVRERTNALEAAQQQLARKNGELLLALAKASEAAELKSQFLRNINHEIRTPINGILGMINLLSESENDVGRSEDIEMLKSSANWLVTLMNDILDISALDAGTMRIECRSFDLPLLLEEVSAVYRSRIEAKGLKFVTTVPPAIPRLASGDPVRLRQVLGQLLGNAIKFTESGQVSLSVECVHQTSHRLNTKFVVEDTGIGITAEQRRQLFEVFVQGDGSSSRKYGGAGLGLALSKQLVALLGGEIGIDNRPSGGTKAWFTAVLDRLPIENLPQAGSLAPVPCLPERSTEETQEGAFSARARGELLSRLSQELRTPLNAIVGFAQVLEMGMLTERARSCVGQIGQAGKQLLKIVEEILDIARADDGSISVSVEPISVKDSVHLAMTLMSPLAASHNIRLTFDSNGSAGEFANADRQRLQQVLLELLSNAIKFNTPSGSVTISIEVRSENRLRITISDTGIGIDPENLARIFRPFERLTIGSSSAGAGLGLALSQRLIQAMGGTIAVTSTPGQGSTFALDLERTPAPVQVSISEAELASNPKRSTQKNTVLYIEDNLSNVKLMENIMEHRPQLGFLIAMQGELGLDLARENHPKLILLDLHLPDIPGHEVLRRLIADRRTRDIPVIVISADATPSQIKRLSAAGASGYLTKPFNVVRLLDLVDEYVADQAVI